MVGASTYPGVMLWTAADGPSAADWLEAWSTLAGAVLSAAAVFTAVVVLRVEQKARRAAKHDVEAAQARFVVVDVSLVHEGDDGWVSSEDVAPAVPGLELQARALVLNNSAQAITNVDIEIVPRNRVSMVSQSIGWMSVSMYQIKRIEPMSSAAVPLRWWADYSPPGNPDGVRMYRNFAYRDSAPILKFNDSAGLTWMRIDNREPERVIMSTDPDIRFASAFAQLLYLPAAKLWIIRRLRRVVSFPAKWLTARLRRRVIRRQTSTAMATIKKIR